MPVIDAQGQGRIFNITSDNVTLNGLKIINGYTDNGGGILTLGSGSVSSCNISDNNCFGDGGGILMSNGSVSGCNISNNTAYRGGGVFDGSVTSCNIIGNTTGMGGGVLNEDNNINISYCRILNNTATNGGVNAYSTNGDLINNNWWGTNEDNNSGINGSLPTNHFIVRLTANTTTNSYSNTMSGDVFHMSPGSVTLGYDLVLNTTNIFSNGFISK